MALSAGAISTEIKTQLSAYAWFRASSTEGQQLCDAIGLAVYNVLTAQATVTPTLLVAPPGGGPVTGTGVIT